MIRVSWKASWTKIFKNGMLDIERCSISNDRYVGCVLYSLSSSASPEPVAHLPRNYLQNLLLRRLPFLVWKGNKQFSKSQVEVQSAIALHTHLKQSFCLALRPSSNVMVWTWATAGLATRISKRAFQYWCQILITLKICNSDIDKHHASVFWIMAIPFFLFSCWQLSSSCQKQKKMHHKCHNFPGLHPLKYSISNWNASSLEILRLRLPGFVVLAWRHVLPASKASFWPRPRMQWHVG